MRKKTIERSHARNDPVLGEDEDAWAKREGIKEPKGTTAASIRERESRGDWKWDMRKHLGGKHAPKAPKNYHWRAVKTRKDAGVRGGKTPAQKLFSQAAKSCPYPKKGTAAARRNAFNRCVKEAIVRLQTARPGRGTPKGRRVSDSSICDDFMGPRRELCLKNLRAGRVLTPR
jgi:hypothetical protein